MIFLFEHATISAVHDGDTFWAVIDLGIRCYTRQKIRVHKVQAVELASPGGTEAQQILAHMIPTGTPIEIMSRRWSYDRLEADVLVKPEGAEPFDLGTKLLAELGKHGLIGGN